MPHITLTEGVPGILGPMLFRPETAKPLNELAEVLLRAPNSLSRAERELIATYVSSQNDCFFCQTVHGAVSCQICTNACPPGAIVENKQMVRGVERWYVDLTSASLTLLKRPRAGSVLPCVHARARRLD